MQGTALRSARAVCPTSKLAGCCPTSANLPTRRRGSHRQRTNIMTKRSLGLQIPAMSNMAAPKAASIKSAPKATKKAPMKAPMRDLPIIANWRNSQGSEPVATVEYPFYTDVSISGEITCGPYSFLNPVSQSDSPGNVTAAIVLRFNEYGALYGPINRPSTEKSDTGSYHGGDIVDEVSALAALFLGARLRPGGMSRIFGAVSSGDPLGRPVGWKKEKPPQNIRFKRRGPIVQSAVGFRSLELLRPLSLIVRLSPEQCIALVRAASFYNDALWICESEPELSWLMLVSAIEVVATSWDSSMGEPLERLQASRPEFMEALQALHVDAPAIVAKEFKDSLGATRKFVDFCLAHMAAPPAMRPSSASQINWSADFWRDALRKIYKYRSLALHAGIPFPAPLCEPPYVHLGDPAPVERGTIALASATLGGSWAAKDLPVNLNLFQQFVREAILTWLAASTWPSGASEFYERRPLYHSIANCLRKIAPRREVSCCENGTSG